MRKKILIAEQSDAIRNIVESLLHQDGYDVILATTAEKAKELIITSEPNMVIIDAGLKDKNNQYLYDSLEESEQSASIPFIIISNSENRELAYPPEVILSRPFKNEEFLEKVRLFIGSGKPSKNEGKIVEVDSFSADAINDEFLDAALGLDSIDVESSEVMDKTAIPEKAQKTKDSDTDPGFGIAKEGEVPDEAKDDSGKVESLMIREDDTKEKPFESRKIPDPTASSKIEIPTDQFDVSKKETNDGKSPDTAGGKDKSHDYNWFIDEMKKDTSNIKFPKPPVKDTDSGKIETTETSEGMETITVPGKSKSKSDSPEIKSGGVDQFISEFKQEMERLNPEQFRKSTPEKAQTVENQKREGARPSDIGVDVNHLSDMIAEKIVKKLTEKIDKEEIGRLIKEYLPQSLVAKNK